MNMCTRQVVPLSAMISWVDSTHIGTIFSVSADHSCALGNDDKIYCWGVNVHGELARQTVGADAPILFVVTGTFTSIATGAAYTYSITTSNTVQCWDEN